MLASVFPVQVAAVCSFRVLLAERVGGGVSWPPSGCCAAASRPAVLAAGAALDELLPGA